VPIGIASILMTSVFIFDPSYIRRVSEKIDYWGIGMLAVAIATLQIVLDKGQEKDWFGTDWITALAVVATVTIIAFLIYELAVEHPVVNLRVFKDRSYTTGVFLMSLLGIGLYGTTVLIPLVLQTLLGYPAVQAGYAMSPRGVGSFIGMPVVGIIMTRFDPRKLLTFGIIVCGFTLVQLSRLDLNAGFWDFCWPQFFMGLALGLVFVPLTTISMGNIPKETMGNATSLFNLVRNMGGSIGISAVSTMQTRFQQRNINELGAHVNPYSFTARGMMQSLKGMFLSRHGDPVAASHQAGAALFAMVARQASMLAYNSIFLVLAVLFVIMLPFIFLMRKPSNKGGPAAMH
jgi:MFS transporter, DHA2 family, multidrug resistance protein